MKSLLEKLDTHCKKMLLSYSIDKKSFRLTVDNKIYALIDNDPLFDEEFILRVPPDAYSDCDGYVYYFGGRFYIQEIQEEETTLTELKYLGKADQNLPTNNFLGIHSGYELMNGIGLYSNWIKKAKFLGVKSLGICEKQTLSGVLDFQKSCIEEDIKPITGISIGVLIDGDIYMFKFYAKDFMGWQNLLKISNTFNVDDVMAIDIQLLKDHLEGLFCIADPKSLPFTLLPDFVDYYQLDAPEFRNASLDMQFIDNLELYLKSDAQPISIQDAYYLEPEDWEIREMVWKTAKAFDTQTFGMYFMSRDSYAQSIINLFKDFNHIIKLYKQASANEQFLVDNCNFLCDTKTRHLPKYHMTSEEASKYSSNEELFIDLLMQGFSLRGIKDTQRYLDRVKVEVNVLKKGDVIDYFLTLHDIVRYAKSENILLGIGRGSAGGSLVSYLLGLIQIDPIEFNLLFERFLNEGRMGDLEDRPAFKLITDEGEIILSEGTLVRIIRNKTESVVFIDDVIEGDEILKY